MQKPPLRHSFQRLLIAPATGYRHETTGALANVGTNGYSLSSSPLAADQVKMGYLNFNADNVNPLESWYRSAGFPVRCVQHLPHGSCFYRFRSLRVPRFQTK